MDVIQKYFEIKDAKVVEGIYNQVYDKYSPEMPPESDQRPFRIPHHTGTRLAARQTTARLKSVR